MLELVAVEEPDDPALLQVLPELLGVEQLKVVGLRPRLAVLHLLVPAKIQRLKCSENNFKKALTLGTPATACWCPDAPAGTLARSPPAASSSSSPGTLVAGCLVSSSRRRSCGGRGSGRETRTGLTRTKQIKDREVVDDQVSTPLKASADAVVVAGSR